MGSCTIACAPYKLSMVYAMCSVSCPHTGNGECVGSPSQIVLAKADTVYATEQALLEKPVESIDDRIICITRMCRHSEEELLDVLATVLVKANIVRKPWIPIKRFDINRD